MWNFYNSLVHDLSLMLIIAEESTSMILANFFISKFLPFLSAALVCDITVHSELKSEKKGWNRRFFEIFSNGTILNWLVEWRIFFQKMLILAFEVCYHAKPLSIHILYCTIFPFCVISRFFLLFFDFLLHFFPFFILLWMWYEIAW